MFITRKALAAELGLNVSRLSHYAKRGMSVQDGGLDREVALDWIAHNVIPQSGQNADKGASRVHRHRRGKAVSAPPTEHERLDPPQEKAKRDRAATRRLELETRLREGQLIPTEEVRSVWARTATLLRTNFLGLPAKVSPRLVGRSAPEMQAILMQEVREILSTLAQTEVRRKA